MNKPKFDPSKPFEAAGSKPKFDPNRAFQAADQAPAEEPSFIERMTPHGDATLGENAQAAWDTIKSMTPDSHTLPDFLESQANNMPIIGPLAQNARSHVDTALGNTKSPEESLENQQREQIALADRSPIANMAGSASAQAINPLNKVTGLPGVAAGLATSVADMGVRKGLNDESINSLIDTGSDGGNITENLALEAGIGLAPMGLGKLADTNLYRRLARNRVKAGLDPTKMQSVALDIKSNKLDTAADAMLDQGLLDKPLQSREELFKHLNTKMGKLGGDMDEIVGTWGEGIGRGDLHDRLLAEADAARAAGNSDLEKAYRAKANAVVSEDVLKAQTGVQRIDKAMSKPKLDYDVVGDQKAALGRRQNIAEMQQEALGDSNLKDGPLGIRQAQLNHTLDSIDERGNLIDAKQTHSQAKLDQLQADRDGLQGIIDDGRGETFESKMLRENRKDLDSKSYDKIGQVIDPDSKAVAGTFRELEEDSIKDEGIKDYYKQTKDRYADLSPAKDLAAKAAAGDETGGLMKMLHRSGAAAVGATVGGAVAGPFGAVVGAGLGNYGQKLATKYGNQLAASGFHKASKILKNEKWAKTLVEAGDRQGAAGINTAHYLLTQRDPEYRKAHQDDQDLSKDQ